MKDFFHLVPGLLLCALPFGGLILTYRMFRLRGEGWRSSLIGSATCSGLYVAFITEILSAFRQITRPTLAIAWIVFDLAIVSYLRHLTRAKPPVVLTASDATKRPLALSVSDYLLLAGIILIVSLVGLTAILAPPNTGDVAAYHLARVVMWAKNQDIQNFPVFYSPQLTLSPWAEYAILHSYVLSGGDYLSNLVEWFSMIGLIVGVSLVAKQLGAGMRGQILAAVSCATIPGLILESSGSMTTGIGAFWIVACIYYFLRANNDLGWESYLAAAATAGLAVLTKGTAYLFLPFLALSCWVVGNAQSRKLWLRRLPVLMLISLALNGPLYIRNYKLSGSPLGFAIVNGVDTERQYANTTYSIGVTFASVVKNAALNLGLPSHSLNNKLDHFTQSALRAFGIDPNDPSSTYRGGFMIPALSANEYTAGSPLQCIVVIAATFLLFRKRYGNRTLRFLLIGIYASFVLYCALIRWTPWSARYYLPLIALGLCIAGVVFERLLTKTTLALFASILLVCAMPFALQNSLRPLAPWKTTSLFWRPRTDFYFEESDRSQEDSYKFAVGQIQRGSCRNVGIDSSMDDFEYPLMAMLRSVSSSIRLQHYQVKNISEAYARPDDMHPCAVICLRCARLSAKWAEYRSIGGRVSTFDEIAVFSSEGDFENNRALEIPQPFEASDLLTALDAARDNVAAAIFAPEVRNRWDATSQRVAQASKDWPGKSLDLKTRMQSIEILPYKAWKARDSVDPMLKRGQRLDYTNADPLQFTAASELLTNWRNEVPERFETVNNLIDQLYTSWEMRLVAIPKVTAIGSPSCTVLIEKVLTTPNHKGYSTFNGQPIQVQNCNCLQGHSVAGTILVQKHLGTYDSEATNATACNFLQPPKQFIGS